jgi:hypothetical protein
VLGAKGVLLYDAEKKGIYSENSAGEGKKYNFEKTV